MIRLAWFEKNQDHDLPTYDYVIKQIKNKEGYFIGKVYNFPYYMFADEFGEISFVILDKNKKTVVGLLIVDIIRANWYQTRLMIINSKYQQKRLGLKLFSSLIKNNNLKLVSDTKQSDGGIKLWKNLYTIPGITIISSKDDSFTEFGEVELVDGNLESTFPLYDNRESKLITDELEKINNKIKDIYDYLDNMLSKYSGNDLKDIISKLSSEDKEKINSLNLDIANLEKEKSQLKYEYNNISAERESDPDKESILVAISTKDKDFFVENKLYEDGGRIVKGVNTTQDVGVDEIKIQAKKFGNTVNRDGYPPILHQKSRKNTTPNKLFNLGMTDGSITESLQSPYNYSWTHKSERNRTAIGKTDDGRTIEARFTLVFKPHDRWNMGFIVDGDDKKTGKGDQYKIFSTVIKMIKDFIEEVSPTVLTFSGSREDDGSDSRIKLYKAIAYKLTQNSDYKVEKFTVGPDSGKPSVVIKIMKKDFEDEDGLREFTELELAIMEGGHTLEEDWKDKARKAAMIGSIAAIGLGGYETKKEYNRMMKAPSTSQSIQQEPFVHPRRPITPTPSMQSQTGRQSVDVRTPDQTTIRPIPRPDNLTQQRDTIPTTRPPQRPSDLNISGTELESYIINYARDSGLSGEELNSFMAQIAHETRGFQRMVETGNTEHFRRYEIRYNPNIANMLGNIRNGDGFRYRGRGYIQLTGRYNYALAGNALGLDLINNPDLAAEPENAARIAIWYWRSRISRRISDFSDIETVTRYINGGINGLESRIRFFNQYRNRSILMRTENVITESSLKLRDLAEIKTNFENADFWLWRRNSEDKVGMPTKDYNPESIGIKVIRTDLIIPDYLFYAMKYLHSQGYFKKIAKGATRLVDITISDVGNISFSLNENTKKRISEVIKKLKESDIIDLNKRREEEKLKSFHKDLMTQVKSGASAMAIAYNIAKDQGLFDDLPVGMRFTLPKGSSYIVKGHTMTGSKTDQLQKHQIEFRKKHNFGPPMFIQSEDRYYRPMINAESVGGEEAGSTMSFELDKLINFETGEKRYKKFTGPRLAERRNPNHVKRKNPNHVKRKKSFPKKSTPSSKGFQDHPYHGRLVGETILDVTPILLSFYKNIIKKERMTENKIDNSKLKEFIDSYRTSPKLGSNYFYCGFVLHDFFPILNFAYTHNSYQLLNLEKNAYIFDINDKNIKFPQYKDIGDANIVSLLFDDIKLFNNFMTDLYLQFSDYRISKTIIDKNILKENISITGTERAELAKKKGLEPGTDEWFAHWFSLPYMIDQRKKKNHRRRMGVKPTIF